MLQTDYIGRRYNIEREGAAAPLFFFVLSSCRRHNSHTLTERERPPHQAEHRSTTAKKSELVQYPTLSAPRPRLHPADQPGRQARLELLHLTVHKNFPPLINKGFPSYLPTYFPHPTDRSTDFLPQTPEKPFAKNFGASTTVCISQIPAPNFRSRCT